jgi:predicted nucleic acid-binding protein
MIIISDTTSLTNLAAVGHLELLHQLYDQVIIPQAVYDEIVNVGYLVPGTTEVQNLSWINVHLVSNKNQVNELLNELDFGEAEAIVIALELNADLLLLDERKGRKVAQNLGIKKITGLLGVLLEAKQKGLIANIKPIIDQLITDNNFWISNNLYQKVIQIAKE